MMPLARTLEEPDTRGDHVLYTHPATWLRDLDPFARPKYLITSHERRRDASMWPGLELSRVMPISSVMFALALRKFEWIEELNRLSASEPNKLRGLEATHCWIDEAWVETNEERNET